MKLITSILSFTLTHFVKNSSQSGGHILMNLNNMVRLFNLLDAHRVRTVSLRISLNAIDIT